MDSARNSLVLVLDAMGVIYKAGDDVVELLIPFTRENGSRLSDDEITKIYVDCSLGNFTSAELWQRLDVPGEATELDRRYLARHCLNPGLIPFLAAMQKEGIPLGCISNDVSEWSRQLRRSFELEPYFFNWTISGDVRIRKPDAGIYEAFLRNTGVQAEHCVFVDDRVKNLDAASRLGFRTVWFSNGSNQTSSVHERVADFKALEQLITGRPSIRQATSGDAEKVAEILSEAAQWLKQSGMAMWREDELLPTHIAADVHAGLFFIAEHNGEAAGVVKFQLEDGKFWPDVPVSESAFVHRLAIRRKFAGGEISSALLSWAVERARSLNRNYLRLDCEAARPKLRAVYEKFGFVHHSDRQVGPYFVSRYEYRVA